MDTSINRGFVIINLKGIDRCCFDRTKDAVSVETIPVHTSHSTSTYEDD
jgi:hypothetical protein